MYQCYLRCEYLGGFLTDSRFVLPARLITSCKKCSMESPMSQDASGLASPKQPSTSLILQISSNYVQFFGIARGASRRTQINPSC